MSFIYDDPNLIDELIRSGLDFKMKFTKQGQAASAAVNNDFSNLNTLISNLEKAVSPAPKEQEGTKAPGAPKVSYEKDPADPTKKPRYDDTSLESLGALVKFLAFNKVTVDGQRVSYGANENPGKPNYQYYKLEPGAGLLERADRAKVRDGFYLDKNLLVKFIQSRQMKLATNPNKVEEVQLGALIQEANDLLDTNIDPKYTPPTIPLNTQLDTLPRILDEKNPNQVPGTEKLFFSDLQSPATLNAWLHAHDIGHKSGDTYVGVKDLSNFDRCVIIRILYTRANAMYGDRNPENENVLAAYVNAIKTIGPAVTGKDGKPCSLGAQQAAAPTSGAQEQQLIDELTSAQLLPLGPDDVNFYRIRAFFEKLKSLVQNSTNPVASAILREINDADTYMKQAEVLMQSGTAPINLGEDAEGIANMLQKPAGQRYIPFLSNVKAVIDKVVEIMGNFYYMYSNKINQSARSLIEAQTMGGNSYAVRNKENLQGLMNDREKIIKFK